jgi:hypothetical protein
MPERDPFVRGMVSWLGFSQAAAEYGGGVPTAGARVAGTQPLKTASGALSQDKLGSVHLPAHRSEDP